MAAALLKSTPRTQLERSATTQQKLAKAAFDLIRSQGYANFRVASVAREAGVSQGGQLHHYPTKELITMAAIEHAIDTAEQRHQRNIARFNEADDPVTALVDDCRDYYFSSSFDVAMDVTKGASDNPDLRRRIARAHRKFRGEVEERWLVVLTARGWSEVDAQDCVALAASLVRGFAIRAMIKPDMAEFERLMHRFRQMVSQSFH